MSGIPLEWLKSLKTDKEKQDFEAVLRNSSMIVDRLVELLDEWDADLTNKDLKETDFDTPNWEVKQAARIGDRRRLKKLRDLFSFRTKKVK